MIPKVTAISLCSSPPCWLIDEPNGYDYEPKLVDFKAHPDEAWFQELLQTGIRPRTKRE
jgi:hypothetical protein